MIPRYTRPEMGHIWTDENRLQIWMEVELFACEAMAAEGLVPPEVPKLLRSRAWKITADDVAAIARIEEETRHDVIAFLTHLERTMGPEARYLHLGMTSSDVLDTTLGVQLDQACRLLQEDLEGLRTVVRDLASTHRHTVMVGRTHGIHAEPITFGLVLALWHQELSRQAERLTAARRTVAVGKCSGAVGTFAHLPPTVEKCVCDKLGITPEPISNQVVQRDRHAELFCTLANLGATIEKIAVNLRHLQRTEVGEVAEPFGQGQRGSSAMPHKKNPIGLENLTGIARLLRSYAQAALENVALWHERDISHSSVERVIAPDATILTDYALTRLTRICRGLTVDPVRMKKNLNLTSGLVFSQTVLLKLVQAGLTREHAYELVQKHALAASTGGRPLKEGLLAEPEITQRIGRAGVEAAFDLAPLLARTDEIFARVFGA
jgi:adenylosuccinate lyase